MSSSHFVTAKFVSNAKGEAQDADDYIVYNSTTGTLSYDADGNGSNQAITFAKVYGDGKVYDLKVTDIVII